MINRSRVFLTFVLTLLVVLACAMPEMPMDDAAFQTVVAQTVAAGLTQKYESPTFTSSPTITFTPSITPVPPTETATLPPTITFTLPVPPTVTNTLIVPDQKIIVTVNTNCRTGPDRAFRVEGTLLKGESTTVHGVDPSGRFFYIRNPDPGIEYCWLSGKYATLGGSIAQLPVLAAMPTPTPTATATPAASFNAVFSRLEVCGSSWVDLELTNTGGVSFTSMAIKIEEPRLGRTYTNGGNGFTNRNGCDPEGVTEKILRPGDALIVSTASVPYNLDGTRVIITVSVCTELNGLGNCLTQTLKFKAGSK